LPNSVCRHGPVSTRYRGGPNALRPFGSSGVGLAKSGYAATVTPLSPCRGDPAVLFDVDGTLVDSSYLHVYAWQRALDSEGIQVAAWRIHRGIGMDGAQLVRTLSGDAPADVQDRLSEAHSRYYREITPLLAPLPGARALLRRVADLGLQVVLASSAPEDELDTLRKVLACNDVISATTSSHDVDTAKPDPAILQVALDRAGVTAERAVFVGDAVWDAQAAAEAGLPCIGMLSGGISAAELEAAGAAPIFAQPQELLEQLDCTRIAALAPNRQASVRGPGVRH
jgi:HAD superfamily hydrolase (TIGR01509 family)